MHCKCLSPYVAEHIIFCFYSQTEMREAELNEETNPKALLFPVVTVWIGACVSLSEVVKLPFQFTLETCFSVSHILAPTHTQRVVF